MMRILGIDPGSMITGFGVIEHDNRGARALGWGCIKTEGGEWPARLRRIYEAIGATVQQYNPDEVAIESAFVHRNAASALKLGQARAAALCGVFDAAGGVFEYAPRAVKLAVVGTGSATKEQVQHMIKALLKLSELPPADAADALAVAVCHAHGRQTRVLLDGLRGRGRRRR
ncbi:MAG TPA: crossover junction endodeoxyribonuclease RuvC [Gammaproteobacteria bacterium]|nr:crossover junction endodeoxyribonuclease RuvC [Gammaproteobacteria bacterium]